LGVRWLETIIFEQLVPPLPPLLLACFAALDANQRLKKPAALEKRL